MIVIELSFPTGRYHATPWGNHVNEAVIEWPPSPWRILRALVATWHDKASNEVEEATMAGLVERLADDLPIFHLAAAQSSHTRHYMPPYSGNTTKVFDAFIHVGAVRSYVVWPSVELDAIHRQALNLLTSRLAYLGRAESWVEAKCVADLPESNLFRVGPGTATGATGSQVELIPLLAPSPRLEFESWRISWEQKRLAQLMTTEKAKRGAKGESARSIRLSKTKTAKATRDLPKSVLEALHANTSDLKARGWSQPPGTRWVTYLRPKELLRSGRPVARRPRTNSDPTVARFVISSKVLPNFRDALYLSDQFRGSLLHQLGKAEKAEPDDIGIADARTLLGGRRGDKMPAVGHHHLHVLVEPNAARGKSSQLSLYAPQGFNQATRAIVQSARVLWRRNGHDLDLVLVGLGAPSDFAGSNVRVGQAPIFSRSRRWRSITPFVSARHLHRDESKDPGLAWLAIQSEVRHYLLARDLPNPIEIYAIDRCNLPGTTIGWNRFATRRNKGGGKRGNAPPMGIELLFAEEVEGPLSLGYGAHFGLGLFAPPDSY